MATDPATTVMIWTPATGKKIAITDISITPAATGTVRIVRFDGADITFDNAVIIEQVVVGSTTVSHKFETPKLNETEDGSVGVVTGANGYCYINLGGFEY